MSGIIRPHAVDTPHLPNLKHYPEVRGGEGGSFTYTTRTGLKFTVREFKPEDEQLLRDFYDSQSEHTLLMRFNTPRLPPKFINHVTSPQSELKIGLAFHKGEMIAESMYGPGDDIQFPDTCFTVADKYQRQGVGPKLMEWAVGRAWSENYSGLSCQIRADNKRMLTLLGNFAREKKFMLNRVDRGSEALIKMRF
ncbi:MAG: GNAT family N-acetyltransferase [Candidatus Altiarchaeales archaeon]|nr:GNAT family N-acetyltransferase [Candidatus Altiarchaeales archaeon]